MTMFLPEDVDGCCSAIYNLNQEWNRDPLDVSFLSFTEFMKDVGTILLNLLQGDG